MIHSRYFQAVMVAAAFGFGAIGGCFSLDDTDSNGRSGAGAAGSTGSGGSSQGGSAGSGGSTQGGAAGAGATGTGGVGGAAGTAGTNGVGGSSTGGGTGTGGSGGAADGGSGKGGAGGGSGGSAGTAGRSGSGGAGTGGAAGTSTGGAAGTSTGGAAGTAGAAGSGGGAAGADGGGAGGAPTAGQLLALVQNCTSVVSTHKYAYDEGGSAMVDICALNGAIFWKADMDIDCDGRDIGDGKCPGNDCCYQPETAYTNKNGMPLAASVTPYVVIPNDFKSTGLKGGTVVAVIYNNKLQYAVLGDTGPDTIIGEASYACAEKLGINPDPGNGGTGSGVTYIVFVGTGTVPTDIENLTETQSLGERLAAQLILNNKSD